ncbi:MAG: hypothetical protein LVS60_05495 [Nodosilinea sp. LVE1205-7]|jgi:hypothetical protein
MQAPEIRATLDGWLWELSRDRTATPPPDALAQLRQHWESLRPKLPASYRPIIDDRMSLLTSYISRA